ncbi:uncharacterized protein LOC119991100 isoform X1 [Tripterygium wilfordii]|uniref:uncharacterized protein LOC119991100 isoform X1 n=1 Tax=Tripterygium wilfordii TaxID=458696 RepID=UPI0018F858EE|nr:uncharacterized protein LOC119991100 isoform X1 [Tripterygium wilfordii]
MGFFIFCLKFSRWWAALVPVSVPCAVETINYEHNNKIVVIHNSICFSGSTFFFFLLAVKPDQTPLTIPLSSLRLSASAIYAALLATRPHADVAYCIHALARRLSKTHNWELLCFRPLHRETSFPTN